MSSKQRLAEKIQENSYGRASGGIEAYGTPSVFSKMISIAPHHISLSIGELAVIAVYYRPSLEMDEVIEDLSQCLQEVPLQEVPNREQVIALGDFNKKTGTPEYEVLETFLESEGLFLRSDPTQPTFLLGQKGSVIDHIFST